MNKSLKYFCRKCLVAKSAKVTLSLPTEQNSIPQEVEIIRSLPNKKLFSNNGSNSDLMSKDSMSKVSRDSMSKEGAPGAQTEETNQKINQETNQETKQDHKTSERSERVFVGRQLECGHFVRLSEPGFTDSSSENLNEQETAIIRNQIEKSMIGKTLPEIKEHVLSWVEQYQTLLKLHSKGRLQAKYALQFIDQCREKYGKLMSEDEKKSFEMKFAHYFSDRPISTKTIERDKKETISFADKQKAALAAAQAIARKGGYVLKDLLKPPSTEE